MYPSNKKEVEAQKIVAEQLNGRLAMLGIIAGIGAYLTTGQLIPGFRVMNYHEVMEVYKRPMSVRYIPFITFMFATGLTATVGLPVYAHGLF